MHLHLGRSFVEKADNGGMVFVKHRQESLLLCVLIQGCDRLTGQKSAVIRALIVNSETYALLTLFAIKHAIRSISPIRSQVLFCCSCGDAETSLLLKSDDIDSVCWAVGCHKIEALHFDGKNPQIRSTLLWETQGRPTCAAAIEKHVWMIGTSDARLLHTWLFKDTTL